MQTSVIETGIPCIPIVNLNHKRSQNKERKKETLDTTYQCHSILCRCDILSVARTWIPVLVMYLRESKAPLSLVSQLALELGWNCQDCLSAWSYRRNPCVAVMQCRCLVCSILLGRIVHHFLLEDIDISTTSALYRILSVSVLYRDGIHMRIFHWNRGYGAVMVFRLQFTLHENVN